MSGPLGLPRFLCLSYACVRSYGPDLSAEGMLSPAPMPPRPRESVAAQSALQRELVSGSTFKPWRKEGT